MVVGVVQMAVLLMQPAIFPASVNATNYTKKKVPNAS
jgi:hypothetical protein